MSDSQPKDTKSSISEKFKARRSEASKEIYENIEHLSNLKTLKTAQVNMLSLRQRLLEDNHTLLEHITVLRKKLREEKAHVMEDLSKNLQLRYQSNENNIVLDGKTSSTREYLEIFENQVAFFNDSIKTIDNIIFGIKTRLDIEKTLGL
jgi:translation initiation factor 2 beta subunit (eIF-2beta)/eIF-5